MAFRNEPTPTSTEVLNFAGTSFGQLNNSLVMKISKMLDLVEILVSQLIVNLIFKIFWLKLFSPAHIVCIVASYLI